MRLDKYLKVSRLIKRRTVANDACDAARITVNGKSAKASYQVKTGDIIEIAFGQRTMKVEVLEIAEHALKAVLKTLFHAYNCCVKRVFALRKGVGSMAENDGAQMHSILLEEREKLRVTGVSDVQSFDEEQVLLETGKGMLIVRGQGLHVEKLQLDAGETVVRGEISLLEYDDSVPPRGGVLRRLFGA